MGLYNETGWRDNTSSFLTQTASGITEPAFEDIGNGLYAHGFTNGEALVVHHHIGHDIKPEGDTYFHVHFAPSTSMTAGQTVTWTITYTKAKGHHQAESFGSVTTSVVLTYTADGTEIANEHLIVEASSPITTPEPDTILLSKVTYGHGTYGSKCYGYNMDLHYEVDRNSTPSKAPDFYI